MVGPKDAAGGLLVRNRRRLRQGHSRVLVHGPSPIFYDVNERLGRFMMNDVLLKAGYPAINLPAKRKLEFNELMLDFYASGDEAPMNAFMRSCVDPGVVKLMERSYQSSARPGVIGFHGVLPLLWALRAPCLLMWQGS